MNKEEMIAQGYRKCPTAYLDDCINEAIEKYDSIVSKHGWKAYILTEKIPSTAMRNEYIVHSVWEKYDYWPQTVLEANRKENEI